MTGPTLSSVQATATQPARELSGDKAGRIVDAMRSSVATHGISGATFERVSREAGVSRGLLHYYFGTKERLLVEVVRRDTEMRMELLERPLVEAATVDQLVDGLVWNLRDLMDNDPGYFALVFEMFTAGRRNTEVERELAELFKGIRSRVADVLVLKEQEGVLKLRFGAHAIVSHLLAIADGVALQALSDADYDRDSYLEVAEASAHFLLDVR